LRNPDRTLWNIKANLAAGHAVGLIDRTGAPRWSRDLIGRSEKRVNPAKDNTFTVHAVTVNMIELLPDPMTDRYRFRAQIRHDESDVEGAVGLFVAHAPCPTDGPDL